MKTNSTKRSPVNEVGCSPENPGSRRNEQGKRSGAELTMATKTKNDCMGSRKKTLNGNVRRRWEQRRASLVSKNCVAPSLLTGASISTNTNELKLTGL